MIEDLVFINLDRRPDRRQCMLDGLASASVPNARRFAAVDGERHETTDGVFAEHGLPTVPEPVRRRFRLPVHELGWDHAVFRAKAGCWISHLRVVEECARKSAMGWTVVCEDDIRFLADWPELRRRFARPLEARPHADLVCLSSKAWQRRWVESGGRCDWSDDERDRTVFAGGTDCYAVRHGSAQTIVDLMHPASDLIEAFSPDGHLARLVNRHRRLRAAGLRGGYWAWCWGTDFATGTRDSDINPARGRIHKPSRNDP